jgi:hypothetical protein
MAPVLTCERGCHCAAANLSGCRSRNAFDEINFGWTFIFREEFAGVFDELLLCGSIFFMQHNGCRHLFSQCGMRATECDRRRDGGMPQQYFIDLVGSDILAAANDDVFNSTG